MRPESQGEAWSPGFVDQDTTDLSLTDPARAAKIRLIGAIGRIEGSIKSRADPDVTLQPASSSCRPCHIVGLSGKARIHDIGSCIVARRQALRRLFA